MPSVNRDNWPDRQAMLLATIANPENRETTRRYLDERRAGNMKPGTLYNEGNAIRGFCEFLGDKRLEDVTKADVTAYVLDARRIRIWRNRNGAGVEKITRREVRLGPATLAQRKVVIKCFYKWLRGGDDYPPEVRWLKTKRREEDQLPVDALVTPDDLARLLQA
ncbi:MAG: hypothetical protein LC623_08980, partial [Halobacteriales archaeon]|nr:hypothetical protein [Halobacteriales archaeon]